MNEFTVLYNAGFLSHPYVDEIAVEVQEFKSSGKIISDASAQAIASWWHSPAHPNSTRLSTMGIVGIETEITDFCTSAEYNSDYRLESERDEVDALHAYILVIQASKRQEKDASEIQEGDILADCPEDGKILAHHVITVDYGSHMGEGMKVYFESGETDIVAMPQRVSVYRV